MTAPIDEDALVKAVGFLNGLNSYDRMDFSDVKRTSGGRPIRYWWRKDVLPIIEAALSERLALKKRVQELEAALSSDPTEEMVDEARKAILDYESQYVEKSRTFLRAGEPSGAGHRTKGQCAIWVWRAMTAKLKATTQPTECLWCDAAHAKGTPCPSASPNRGNGHEEIEGM